MTVPWWLTTPGRFRARLGRRRREAAREQARRDAQEAMEAFIVAWQEFAGAIANRYAVAFASVAKSIRSQTEDWS